MPPYQDENLVGWEYATFGGAERVIFCEVNWHTGLLKINAVRNRTRNRVSQHGLYLDIPTQYTISGTAGDCGRGIVPEAKNKVDLSSEE